MALIRTGLELEAIDRVCTSHRATEPAAIRDALGEVAFPDGRLHAEGIGVRSILEVFHGQRVVTVHDFDEVRGTLRAHLRLVLVEGGELAVDTDARLGDPVEILDIVHIRRDGESAYDDRLDLLVPQHRADAAAPGLLQARRLAAQVVEGEVQTPDQRVLRACSGRDYRNIGQILLIGGIHLREKLGQHVTILLLERCFFDSNLAAGPIDYNDHLFIGDALDLERIEAGRLEQGTRVATDVRIDRNPRHGRERDDQRLATARILGQAAEGPAADHDFIFGIIPFRLRGDRVP